MSCIQKTRHAFHSICWKLLLVLTVSTLAMMLVFSAYFFSSTRRSSLKKYEDLTESAFDVSVSNIDYYISNCIGSAKSIYVNNALLTTMTQVGIGGLTPEETMSIFSYLQSIYYSTSTAKQIFLAVPRLGRSFLFVSGNLQTSSSPLRMTVDEMPKFSSYHDIYIQPTHQMHTYGHLIGFSSTEQTNSRSTVFTIWLPLYNLPWTVTPIAYLAIDMPIEFIRDNCQLAYTNEESVYIVDDGGNIIVSTREEDDEKNILEVCPASASLSGDSFSSITYDDQLVMQAPMNSDFVHWKMIKTAPVRQIFDTSWRQSMLLLITFVASLTAVLVINTYQILHYTIPLRRITEYMKVIVDSKSWRKDLHLSDFVVYRASDEIGSLVSTFETMMSSINDYTIRQYELELAYARSVLKMLQAQINPHFIYNTIQCFATNALKDKDLEQYHMISAFGQMLHYAMSLEPTMVPLRQEVEYVRRYLLLQKMRFNSSDDAEYSIHPGAYDQLVPRMTLQPLVENSIIHGHLLRAPGSILQVTVRLSAGQMQLSVADNGVAVSSESVAAIKQKIEDIRRSFSSPQDPDLRASANTLLSVNTNDRDHGAFIGIENVYARLLLNFGACSFDIFANEIGGTTASFSFPMAQ